MTAPRTAMGKQSRWAECQQVSELALLIDALPPGHRSEIARAALTFEATSKLSSGYIVGEIRSLIADSVAQLFGHSIATKLGATTHTVEFTQALAEFAFCGDPARVQLAVCDLIECIVSAVNVSE